MTTVVRVRRQGGEVVQWCDVYIGRACYRGGWELPQSKWCNPFTVKKYGERCLELYREHLYTSGLINDIEELRGKVLGCWCKPGPCHGDILVEELEKTSTVKVDINRLSPKKRVVIVVRK